MKGDTVKLAAFTFIFVAIVLLFLRDSPNKVQEASSSSLSAKANDYVAKYFPSSIDSRVRITYQEWKNCFESSIEQFRGVSNAPKLWVNITDRITQCGKMGSISKLKIIDIYNKEEIKYHILPVTPVPEPTVLVTLGVGKNTIAEEILKPKLLNTSRFYGADPIVEINRDKYSKFGTFFPFAVSSKGGMLKASVLLGGSYHDRTVVNVDLNYFLKNILREDLYDTIWMDAEYAEFDLFRFFHKGGILDESGIVVCQMNVEAHKPSVQQMEQFHSFIFQLLEDDVYAVVRCVDVGHLRLFFLNFRDQRCVDKYLQDVYQ